MDKKTFKWILLLIICLTFSSCSFLTETSNGDAIHTGVEYIQESDENNPDGENTELDEPQKESDDSNSLNPSNPDMPGTQQTEGNSVLLANIPVFSDIPYVVLDDNIPDFSNEDMTTEPFERYSDLDSLGRCGAAFANVGTETMSTDKRGSIGQIKPSGWHISKYDFVDGKYLYNRCHLIGYQLTAENDNEKNLITGTRYMNVEGMLPFENQVASYVKDTGNHALYRVTPIFNDKDLIARGVRIEAYSVEDDGNGVCFDVFCYNNQPGVEIDYDTGDNRLAEVKDSTPDTDEKQETFVLNMRSKKIHYPDCPSVAKMSETNKKVFTGTYEKLILQGYSPCGNCMASRK